MLPFLCCITIISSNHCATFSRSGHGFAVKGNPDKHREGAKLAREVIDGSRAVVNHFKNATQKKEVLWKAIDDENDFANCLWNLAGVPEAANAYQGAKRELTIDGKTRMYSQVLNLSFFLRLFLAGSHHVYFEEIQIALVIFLSNC